MNAKKTVKIRVFRNLKGRQNEAFSVALANIKKISSCWCDFNVEYINKKSDIPFHWTPVELIDWILDSDFHFILTHVHQSIERFDCATVVRELQRLRGHKGFPQDEELKCPVFLQDKRVYIEGAFL